MPITAIDAALVRADYAKLNPDADAWRYDLTHLSVLADEVKRLRDERQQLIDNVHRQAKLIEAYEEQALLDGHD